MFFQIGVNCSRRFLCAGVGGNLPGAAFIFAAVKNESAQAVCKSFESAVPGRSPSVVAGKDSAASASLISASSASTLPQIAVAAAFGREAISVSLYLLTASSSSLPSSVTRRC